MIWNEEVVIDMFAYFLQALLQASVIYNEIRVEEKRQSYWIFVGLYFLSLVIRIFRPDAYWGISIIVVGVLFIYGKSVSPFHSIEVLLTILFYEPSLTLVGNVPAPMDDFFKLYIEKPLNIIYR